MNRYPSDPLEYAVAMLRQTSTGHSLDDRYPGLFQDAEVPALAETVRAIGKLGRALHRETGVVQSHVMASLAAVLSAVEPTDEVGAASVVAFGDKLFRGNSGAYDQLASYDPHMLMAAAESLSALQATLNATYSKPGETPLDTRSKAKESLRGLDAAYHFAAKIAGEDATIRRPR